MVTSIHKNYTKGSKISREKIAKIVSILTEDLIGEICHQVRFSYGDELRLDCGEMSFHKHPKLQHLSKGSWRFGTRATPWQLKRAGHLLADSQQSETDNTPDETKKLIQNSLKEKKIIGFELNPDDLGFQLSFENQYVLRLQPELEDDSGLAYWELFMPTDQILEFGPGCFWSFKSIHDQC